MEKLKLGSSIQEAYKTDYKTVCKKSFNQAVLFLAYDLGIKGLKAIHGSDSIGGKYVLFFKEEVCIAQMRKGMGTNAILFVAQNINKGF